MTTPSTSPQASPATSAVARGRARIVLPLLIAVAATSGCAEDAPAPVREPVAAGSPAELARTLEEARALLERGELEEARARLRDHAAAHGEDGSLLTLQTEILSALGDVEAAVESGERATELAPDSSAAHLQYSRALGRRMMSAGMLGALRTIGTYKDALRRARELDPSDLEARTDEIVFHLAAPRLAGGSKAKGRALAEELTALDRDRGWPLLAWAISVDEDVDAAIDFCRERLAEAPGNRALRLTLARMLGDEERVDEAVPHFESVLAGDKDERYYEALYQLARLRIRAEVEPRPALSALEEYAADAPVRPELPSAAAAWWRIGNAHELLSDTEAARAAYEQALALDPGFEQAADALDALD